MIEVHITIYPPGKPERTFRADLPGAPRVGDSVHLGYDDVPIIEITHVVWVRNPNTWGWHVECSAR